MSVPAGAALRNAREPSVPPAPTFNVEPSVPASVSVLLTVRVLDVVPPAMVNPVAAAVSVRPLTLVGVIAPSVRLMAGVVVAVATVPETPLAVVTDTLVTVPDPAEAAAQVAVVPLEVSTYPFVPMARRVELLVPLPIIRSPVDVTGDRALNPADAVVWPVPPYRIPTATPFQVEPVMEPAQDNVLVDQLAFVGAKVWLSHVPAAGLLTSKVVSTADPDCSVATVVAELFRTTIVPEDWLLLNR